MVCVIHFWKGSQASNICEHPVLVKEGVRGFLCDPMSFISISNTLNRFVNLTALERMVLDYESLFSDGALKT